MRAIMYTFDQSTGIRSHEESEVTIAVGDQLISLLGLSYTVTRITDLEYWVLSPLIGRSYPTMIWNFDASFWSGIVKMSQDCTGTIVRDGDSHGNV